MAIDEAVKAAIEERKGFVIILAGSDSDKPHINKVSEELDKYGIRHQVRICSAHKQPRELAGIIEEVDQILGTVVYIAIAGGTDALSGTVSFLSKRPVISCPSDGNNTTLTNPLGSSNATVLRPQNAARFIAQMFSSLDERYARILREEVDKKVRALEEADARLRQFPYRRE
ncbi:MAG: AIR carboxylase family protein [Candidatus Woesearchaeota archaeon]|nr:MAG: AIR carboxylase family protein [Candidatus Woesearchaeota archaeon]